MFDVRLRTHRACKIEADSSDDEDRPCTVEAVLETKLPFWPPQGYWIELTEGDEADELDSFHVDEAYWVVSANRLDLEDRYTDNIVLVFPDEDDLREAFKDAGWTITNLSYEE